jgi:hypothetical protein
MYQLLKQFRAGDSRRVHEPETADSEHGKSKGKLLKKASLCLAFILMVLGSYSLSAQTVHNLNDNVNGAAARKSTTAIPQQYLKEAKAARAFAINPALQRASSVKVGDMINLQLFEGESYMAKISVITSNVNGNMTLMLKLPDYPMATGFITTSTKGKSLFSVSIPELNRKFTSKGNVNSQESYLVEIDENIKNNLINDDKPIPKGIRMDGDGSTTGKSPMPRTLRDAPSCTRDQSLTGNDPASIGLLIVYTPAAKAWADAEENGIENTIAGAMAQTAAVIANQGNGDAINLVHSALIDYTEVQGDGMGTDLDMLTGTSDGYMDEVHQLRKEKHADIVALFEDHDTSDGTGGLGWILFDDENGDYSFAFNVVHIRQASWTTTSIHEIGHNMGMLHEKEQYPTDPWYILYPYAYGWHWTGTDGIEYGSVMSYIGNETPYFSNPLKQDHGKDTGTATANNAQVFRNTKHVVAFYSDKLGNIPAAPTNIQTSNPTNNGITITWTASADAVKYWVCACQEGDQSYTMWGITGTSYTLNSSEIFQPCNTYEVWVRAENTCGDLGESSPRTTFTTACASTPPTISSTSLPNGIIGTEYSRQLETTSSETISWSLTSGSLPAGLTLSSGGLISGTPTAEGTSTFTVKATAGTMYDTKQLSITIAAALSYSISLSPSTLSFGSLTSSYSQPDAQTVTITNTGTGTITLSQPSATNYTLGTLSATELAADATATFTVQPNAGLEVGEHNEEITVSGSNGVTATVSATFTVTAAPMPPTITTESLPDATVAAAYSQALTATGTGTITWSIVDGSGSLPAGLILSEAGVISGTPTTEETVNFSVKASNDEGYNEKELSITVSKAILGGNITITGSFVFGETLTAITDALTASPEVPLGAISYQWKRDDVDIPGETNETYTLAEADIDKIISVTVTAANCSGSVSSDPSAEISKATQDAPAAPTLASKTATSIILNAITGAEYSIDGGTTWQIETFDNLNPNTSYSFTARLAGTATHLPSPASSPLEVTTEKATLGGTVTITGTPTFGETLTVDITGLSSSPEVSLGTISYQWKRNNVDIEENATGETYTIVEADISKTISVTVTAENCSGSVSSDPSAAVSKATQPAPAAPTCDHYTATRVVLNIIAGAEYSKDDGATWQDSPEFTGLTSATPYSFIARLKETATHTASPASDALSVTTATAQAYGISFNVPLDDSGTYSFPDATGTYGAQAPLEVVVTNEGLNATDDLEISLTGDNADAFVLSSTSITSIAVGSTETFSISLASGLAAGTYTASVVIGNEHFDHAYSFNISFTVNAVEYAIAVATGITNGSIAPSASSASAGTVITITASPASGYEVNSISAYKTGDPSAALTLSGSGNSRNFTMPAYNVTVTATFRVIYVPTPTPDPDPDPTPTPTPTDAEWTALQQAISLLSSSRIEIPQVDAPTKANAEAWLMNYVNALLKDNGFGNISISYLSVFTFNEATAGTTEYASGVNGSLIFDLILANKYTQRLNNKTATIVATVHTANEVAGANALKAFSANGTLYISGLIPGQPYSVYNTTGALVFKGIAGGSKTEIAIPVRGLYIIRSANETVKAAL